MGMDVLDLAFRIEKAFDLRWERIDHERMWSQSKGRDRVDLTADEVHKFVCTKLQEANKPIPSDSWRRVQVLLADKFGESPNDIKPGTFLRQDLGHD